MPADADPATEPMASRTPHLLHAPADVWHDEPVESWRHVTEGCQRCRDYAPRRRILDLLHAEDPPAPPAAEPIGFAHNGFHVDDEQRFQPVDQPSQSALARQSAARHAHRW